MPSLKKKILNNGIASILSKGVRVLDQLLLVPFFITAWGAAYYGEWLTLTIIPSVIAFSDLGFGTAAANTFVLDYAAGDYQEAANVNKTGLVLITYMVFSALIISLIILLFLNYINVFDKSLINGQDAIVAVSILILARLLNFYSQLFESYYRAAQRAALSIHLLTLKSLLSIIIGVLVLLMGYGIVFFAISQLLVILFFNLFYWWKGTRILSLFKNYKGEKDKKKTQLIISKGLGYLMSPVWQSIYFQGTTFVVRIVLGPEAVAVFNTARTLSRSVIQIYNITYSSVFPELQFELASGRIEKGKKLFRISIFLVFFTGILGVIFLGFFGLQFYNVWTQNQLEVPKIMWYILIAGILFNALWWTAGMIYKAINKPRKFAFFGLISATFSVVISFFLSLKYGLNGAALGSILMDILMTILILPDARRLMDMKVRDLFKHGFSDVKLMTSRLTNN